MNIIIDATYYISGIYTNLRAFLCKRCDVKYYVINDTWCLQKKIVLSTSVCSFSFIITQNV